MYRKSGKKALVIEPSLEYKKSFLNDNTCPQCLEEYDEGTFRCNKCALFITQE